MDHIFPYMQPRSATVMHHSADKTLYCYRKDLHRLSIAFI